MFIEESPAVNRPSMAVFAPDHEFLYKYFDREFDMNIVQTPDSSCEERTAFVVTDHEKYDQGMTEAESDFRDKCMENNMAAITIVVPAVVGTGMGSPVMDIARKIAQGLMYKISGNNAQWSVVHASDIPRAALHAMQNGQHDNFVVVLPGKVVKVNDLTDALAHRIRNKTVGTISPRWARMFFSGKFLNLITTDRIFEKEPVNSVMDGFECIDAVEYMKTHDYSNENF